MPGTSTDGTLIGIVTASDPVSALASNELLTEPAALVGDDSPTQTSQIQNGDRANIGPVHERRPA